jgi:hypothetical protein
MYRLTIDTTTSLLALARVSSLAMVCCYPMFAGDALRSCPAQAKSAVGGR